MYLTAMRVARVDGGRVVETGVNAFRHDHNEAITCPLAKVPTSQPGVCTGSAIAIRPGGNRVITYLDLVARDALPLEQVYARLGKLLAHSTGNIFPWVYESDEVFTQFGAVASYAESKDLVQEYFALATAVYAVFSVGERDQLKTAQGGRPTED